MRITSMERGRLGVEGVGRSEEEEGGGSVELDAEEEEEDG